MASKTSTSTSASNPENWTVDQVYTWLNDKGQEVDLAIEFKANMVDGHTLLSFTEIQLTSFLSNNKIRGARLFNLVQGLKALPPGSLGSGAGSGAETVADRIGRVLGNPLKDQDILILHQHFGAYVSLYEKRDPSVAEARKLAGLIAAVIRSQTVRDLHQQGYLFNGIVGGAGSGRSTIYSVYQISTRTAMAAKVYTSEMFSDATLELQISEEIKNSQHTYAGQIIQYTQSFEFYHHDHQGKLKALIMPRFHDSLQNFLSALAHEAFDERASSELARVLLQVGCVFLALGKAHSDIKPNNVMITNGSFKLIDLGSTTKFGTRAEELTPRFYLDANVHEADHKLDLYCIATTLALCAGVKDNDKPLTSLSCTTATGLRSLLALHPHKAAKIAMLCLDPSPSFNCENALQAATAVGLFNE